MSLPVSQAIRVAAKIMVLSVFAIKLSPAIEVSGRASQFAAGMPDNGIVVDYNYNYIKMSSVDGLTQGGYGTWTDPNGHSNVKYVFVTLGNFYSSGSCFEVYTSPVNYSATGTDTRIYAMNSGSTYQSASDDRNGSDYTSRLRAWIGSNGATISLTVQGYSSGYNGIDFNLITERIPGFTSSASCQVSGVPFLEYNASTGFPNFIGTN